MIPFTKRILKLFLLIALGLISAIAMQFFPMAIAQPPTAQSSITNNAQVAPEDWLQRGRETYQNGLYAKAAEYWLNAANLYQRDKLNLALVWNYLSLAYQQLNRFDEAKNAISTSLDLLVANQNTDTIAQRQQILARSLTTSARLELAKGQAENALDILKQAEAIYKQIGDMQGVIGSQINQAQALQALGRYRRALQTLNQVEETLKKPETFNTQLDPLIKATKLYSLGNTLQVVGDLEHSWCVFQDSLAVAEQLQNSQLIGDIYLSLGNTARAFGRRVEDLQGPNSQQKLPLTIPKNCQKPPQEDTALGFYQQAGEWYEKVAETESFSDSTRLQAQLNYLNILVSVLSTEAWKDSWPNYLAEVDKLWPNIYDRINSLPPSRQEVYAKINLTKNLILLNKKSSFNQPWSIIDQLLQQAIAHAKNLEDPKAQTYALGTYGWLYEEQKNYGEAQKFTEQALSLANEIQAPNIKYQWEWQLGRIYAAQENLKDAIAAYEKALETIDVVRKGLVGIPLDLAGINSDIQFYFRDNVEPIYREAVDLVLRSENPDLEKVRQLIDNLQVAELENYLQCSLQNANFLEIEQIPHTTEVVVIYPILLNDRIEVIFSLPSGASTNRFLHRYTSVDTPKTKVEQTLKELRRQLELEFPDSKARKLSQQVYDWIIRPAEKDSLLEPTKNQTLVFVLDGLLRNIPMAALYDGKDYLIEKYPVAVAPALQLSVSPTKRQLRALIAGLSEDPEFRGFSALSYVREEINKIKEAVKKPVPKELFNDTFTSNSLETEISSNPYTIIHIATHGQFSSNPQQTFILTTPKERSSGRSNIINIIELDSILRQRTQTLPDPIELLVFSACQTALGDNRAVLGIAGVSVRAGARSTVATLWSVADKTTARFMGQFYQELVNNRNITKAEALRRAQLDFIKDEKSQPGSYSPFHWAPYILVGDWR